jgi:hypothetical protein
MYTDRLPLVDWNAKSRARTGCLFLLLMLTNVAQSHAFHYVSEVRTLNLDFGNAGAYVGDDGVLSASGGTHWNEIRITTAPPNSGGVNQFDIPTLLDEFGQSFGPGLAYSSQHHFVLPEIVSGSFNADATTTSANGPLNDGVSLRPNGSLFFSIRVLDQSIPFDLVIYLNRPTNSTQFDTININPYDIAGEQKTNAPFGANLSGQFPGNEGLDYFRFSNITPVPTTLGEPELPGVMINVPFGAHANIAAIQIRGAFVFPVPEPVSAAMLPLACAAAALFRRWRH